MWAGRVRAGRVVVIAEQLMLNPLSRCRMIRLGGDPRWIGWDQNAEIAATQLDTIRGLFLGQDFSDADRFPRPGDARGGESPASTPGLFAESIEDFDPAAFMRVINGP